MANTAATAKKGVARRTRFAVQDGFGAFRGPAPGNTSETSPPLAGWKVRRLQSVDAPVSPEPLLTELAAAVIQDALIGRSGALHLARARRTHPLSWTPGR